MTDFPKLFISKRNSYLLIDKGSLLFGIDKLGYFGLSLRFCVVVVNFEKYL